MSPRLLVTGFEPFAQYAINPSWVAAERAEREFHPKVIARCLPVDHHLARQRLLEILDQLAPEAILAMGLAAGDEFRIECAARKSKQFADLPGEMSHCITCDRDAIAATLKRLNVPWRYSDDAGQYVCESTYWSLLQHMKTSQALIPCGFLHVPAESPAWPADRTAEVVCQVVADLLKLG